MRKINGMEVQEVLEKLKFKFTSAAKDFKGHSNIPYEVIREKANEILGFNYSDEYENAYHLIEGEHVIMCTVTITINDDEGNFVAKRSHTRSDAMTRYSSNKKISFDGDEFSSVHSLAFKKAFTKFGLGDQFALDLSKKNLKHPTGVSNGNNQGNNNQASEKIRGFLTYMASAEQNKVFIFQNPEGKPVKLTVSNPNNVKNMKKLLSVQPGTQVEVIANKKMELLEVA